MDARLPAPLTIKGNASQNFKKFRQSFEIYMLASGKAEKEDNIKVATLLNLMGEEGLEVFNTLELNHNEKQDYGKVLSEIETFFCQKKDVVYERFLFYSRKQRKGETFDSFLRDVKKLAARCEFAEPENMIRDIIILGVYSKILQDKLLQVEQLDVKKAIQVCKANESNQLQEMNEVQGEYLKAENIEKPGESQPDDDKTSESLYNRIRSVLNKLTPNSSQMFDTLMNQVRQLQIDTKDRLQGVIDLVFVKAMNEPKFSIAYARMCRELQIFQVNTGTAEEDKKTVAFRTLLVIRCQVEFEKQFVDATERNRKVRIINECSDSEKKKNLRFELEEYDRRLRKKSLDCIRFIGELFQQQMLTANIMLGYLKTLIDNKDEVSLECLCKLLTTVGKELETKNINLSDIFDEMKRIIDGKKQKDSRRIRFMLQDVTELRYSKWIPRTSRRNDANPKTMDQTQKEAENEHLNEHEQVMNMNTPRKVKKGKRRRSGGGPRQKASDTGGNSVDGSRNTHQQLFLIQTDKTRTAKLALVDEPLGSSQLYGNWGKEAGDSKNVQPPVTTSTNMYATLENIDMGRLPSESQPDYYKTSEYLYNRVKSILNKLTPYSLQSFDTFANQVRQLQIDTKEKLQGVVDLVFDKAINDRSSTVAYARMCKELQMVQVNAGLDGENKKIVSFRTLLLTRCQMKFEKQSEDETERNRKVKLINECADPETRKELCFELMVYDSRLRMKSVGCTRFIGELFMQQMVPTIIIVRCLRTLIDNKDEESLECLCMLLTTVGKELETKDINLSGIFVEIKRLIDRKKKKVSSRIRLLLQDVTKLRDSKWMDQIQKEAETENFNIPVMNMNPIINTNTPLQDDGWNSGAGSQNNRQQFSIQTDTPQAPPQIYSSAQCVMPSIDLQPNMYYNPAQRPSNNIVVTQTYTSQVYQQQLAFSTYPRQQSSGVSTYAPLAYYSQQPAARSYSSSDDE